MEDEDMLDLLTLELPDDLGPPVICEPDPEQPNPIVWLPLDEWLSLAATGRLRVDHVTHEQPVTGRAASVVYHGAGGWILCSNDVDEVTSPVHDPPQTEELH